jgi:hypothetical protein
MTATGDPRPSTPLLDAVLNLSHFHREHEKFYATSPRELAVELQRHARTLHALADRWSTIAPSSPGSSVEPPTSSTTSTSPLQLCESTCAGREGSPGFFTPPPNSSTAQRTCAAIPPALSTTTSGAGESSVNASNRSSEQTLAHMTHEASRASLRSMAARRNSQQIRTFHVASAGCPATQRRGP